MNRDAWRTNLRMLLTLTRVEWMKYWNKTVARVVLVFMLLTPLAAEALLVKLSIRDAMFPRVSQFLFSPDLMMFLGMIMIVLAVLALGSDFDLGTVRTTLSRGVPRAQFIIAKVVAVIGAALVNAAVYVIAGMAAVATVHLTSGGPPIFEAAGRNIIWRGLASVGMVGTVTFVLAGIVMLAVVLGRSSWTGMLAGLGFFFVDFIVGGVGVGDLLGMSNPHHYTMTYYALSVYERLFPSDPTVSLPRAWAGEPLIEAQLALIILFLYGVGATAAAIVAFNRQDLLKG
jgi:ABC-type transport system involved in multi-copper enzyme maturation permease subunit